MSDTFGTAMPGRNEPNEFPANGVSGENNASDNAAFEDCDIESITADTAAPKLSQGERRSRRRALISAPVRVRSIDVTGSNIDEVSTTLDVSRGGVLFVSSLGAFAKGMEVAVTFPYSKSPVAVQAEQVGRIARVTNMTDGRQSVGVALGAGVEADLVDTAGHKLISEAITAPHDRRANSGKPLVLIVDADPAIRTSLKIALGADGYDVVAVSFRSRGARSFEDVYAGAADRRNRRRGFAGLRAVRAREIDSAAADDTRDAAHQLRVSERLLERAFAGRNRLHGQAL